MPTKLPEASVYSKGLKTVSVAMTQTLSLVEAASLEEAASLAEATLSAVLAEEALPEEPFRKRLFSRIWHSPIPKTFIFTTILCLSAR